MRISDYKEIDGCMTRKQNWIFIKTDAHVGKEKLEMKDMIPDFKQDEDETGWNIELKMRDFALLVFNTVFSLD